MKILFWDIESTSFNADHGIILCLGYKWAHENKVNMLTIRHKRDEMRFIPEERFKRLDKDIVRTFSKVLQEADLHVYYFGSKFDIKFLQARALLLGLPPIHPPKDLDVVNILWKHYKFSSYKMDNITKLLKKDKEHPGMNKTKFSPYLWHAAAFGYPPALKAIEEHCRRDVILLEFLFDKVKELDSSFPRRINSYGTVQYGVCPYCGSSDYHRNGVLRTAVTRRIRLKCKECGRSWSVPEKSFKRELKKCKK